MRRLITLALLALLWCPGFSEEYYTYYRVKPGDTIVSIALDFKSDRGTILAMNPTIDEARVKPGDLLCVPNPNFKQAETQVDWEKIKASAPRPAAPKPVAIESEDTTNLELKMLEQYAVEGQEPAHSQAQSVLITDDGRVIEIPSRGEPQPRRRSLSSRRGRALFGLLKTARSLMGVPYVWGGESPTGADCSGYVQLVFARHGVKLPRTADIQYKVGQVIANGHEQPGDLVFFETYAPGASHVGIYLGQRHFIHASSRAKQVTISSLDEPYFKKRYLGARRNL